MTPQGDLVKKCAKVPKSSDSNYGGLKWTRFWGPRGSWGRLGCEAAPMMTSRGGGSASSSWNERRTIARKAVWEPVVADLAHVARFPEPARQ